MGAYINEIATAVPPTDVHGAFLEFARSQLSEQRREQLLFRRMAAKSGIEHRYSFVEPGNMERGVLDKAGLFEIGRFPDTATRMRFFERNAPHLAEQVVERLVEGRSRGDVTHLLVTCCTGLSSPGLDLEVTERCGLNRSIERSVLGFMGCCAALNALRLARHIVHAEPDAQVLVVSLELCTVHLQETRKLEELLSFLLWGDGAAACLVTAQPPGLSLDRFYSVFAEDTHELIRWNVRNSGFDMLLSGQVPSAIHDALRASGEGVLDGGSVDGIELWAVHPGGRSVLDAVDAALELPPAALGASRETLRRYGNMSSATVLFVLKALLEAAQPGERGCAMAFGPGLVAETMLFHNVADA